MRDLTRPCWSLASAASVVSWICAGGSLLNAAQAHAEVVLLCQVSAMYVTYSTAGSCNATGPFGSSFGSADLATGEARATATYTGVSGGTPIADVYMRDTLTVTGPWSTSSITALLRMDVTGSLTSAIPGESHIGALWTSSNGGVGASLSLNNGQIYQNVSGLGSVSSLGTTTVSSYESYEIAYQLELPIELTPSSPQFFFQALLRAYPYGGGTADFGNTGRMSLVLPSGFAFTSASGVFLTSPVPLPAPVLLLASGLLALLGVGSRARRVGASQVGRTAPKRLLVATA